MISAIRAEFRKLLSIRSTYIITAFALLFVTFFAFYVEGIKAGASVADPNKLASEVTGAIGAVSIFAALVGLLLMAHEYRYNTIMYTLTSSNKRSKILFAKIIAVSVFAVVFSLLVAVYSPLMTYIGIHLKGLTLAPQTLHYGELIWKTVLVGWGYAMIGLLLAALIRNQVGAIIVLLLFPTTIETLLGLILKKNAAYLPFTALQQVTGGGGNGPRDANAPHLSPGRGALVFAAYLVIGWIVAWILFQRRDANNS